MKKVLDHGYVNLVNVMGSDTDVVNAARASYEKEVSTLEDRDIKLINYLVSHKHDSTLRHCVMTFEVYAPLMVARQWYKHAVSSTHLDDQMGWNESSRRYVSENEKFYIPDVDRWRATPENSKQGSGDDLSKDIGVKYTQALRHLITTYHQIYCEALKDGVAPEQARLLLPAYSLYVRWRWTASLNAVLHFCELRTKSGAQSEMRDYADAILEYTQDYFPHTTKAWREFR